MNHNYPALNMQIWKVAIISILLSLTACTREESSTLPVTQTTSTKLVNNTISTELNFSNFKDTTFYLDPFALPFSGEKLFLKLSGENNKILFMGEIDRYRAFSIKIQIRLDDTQLYYELFTNDVSDITQFGVINL